MALRVFLLGKAGSGKTSLRSMLLEESRLNSEAGGSNHENGILTTVVDTPGFFDTNMPEETLKNETVNCLAQCGPGPHAFLIVSKVDRYTVQNEEVIHKILENFSEEALKFAIMVFTHGDNLNPGEKIEDFVKTNEALSALVKKCGGRCHIVDNKHWNNNDDDYRNNKFQVNQLLSTLEKMKQTGGYYTNEMLQKVEKEGKKAKRDFNKLLCRLISALGGTVLGAIFGAALCRSNRIKTELGAGIGAVFGACVGYSNGEKASTPGEAAIKTMETVTAVGKGFMQANDALQSGGSKDKED